MGAGVGLSLWEVGELLCGVGVAVGARLCGVGAAVGAGLCGVGAAVCSVVGVGVGQPVSGLQVALGQMTAVPCTQALLMQLAPKQRLAGHCVASAQMSARHWQSATSHVW